jgi:hypothetical protein
MDWDMKTILLIGEILQKYLRPLGRCVDDAAEGVTEIFF